MLFFIWATDIAYEKKRVILLYVLSYFLFVSATKISLRTYGFPSG